MKKWNDEQQGFLDTRVYVKYPKEPIPDEGEESRKYRALVEFLKAEQGMGTASFHITTVTGDSKQVIGDAKAVLSTKITSLEKQALIDYLHSHTFL